MRAGVSDPKATTAATAPISPHERTAAIKTVGGSAALKPASSAELGPKADPAGAPASTEADVEDEAAVATRPALEDNAPFPIDEAAEAAFLSEARERGEVVPRRSAAEIEEEAAPKALPSLDELVHRIPAEVRETLDDLFRVRFVRVQRMPKKAFKQQ